MDDSKPLLGKWLEITKHPSIYKWLFGVPGIDPKKSLFACFWGLYCHWDGLCEVHCGHSADVYLDTRVLQQYLVPSWSHSWEQESHMSLHRCHFLSLILLHQGKWIKITIDLHYTLNKPPPQKKIPNKNRPIILQEKTPLFTQSTGSKLKTDPDLSFHR